MNSLGGLLIMQCSSCGTQLPERAAYCPACAAPTPYGLARSGATPHDLTTVSSLSGPSSYTPPPPPPPTNYGSSPYGAPPLNPYESRNLYTAPSSPPPRRRPNKVLWIASIAVALVIIIGGITGVAIFHN